jgi:hypothetical protein
VVYHGQRGVGQGPALRCLRGATVHPDVLQGQGPDQRRRTDLIHKNFTEIANHYGDRTAHEVKAECNLTYGRPILDRDDEEWKAAFGYIFDNLNHAAKLKAIRVLDIPIHAPDDHPAAFRIHGPDAPRLR